MATDVLSSVLRGDRYTGAESCSVPFRRGTRTNLEHGRVGQENVSCEPTELLLLVELLAERLSFKAYESLNRLQSIVFPVAYHTNENMLVCAPTGAVRPGHSVE